VEHPIELTAESLWDEVSSRLREALNETTFRTWFGDVNGVELGDDRFVLSVPNDFTRPGASGTWRWLSPRAASGPPPTRRNRNRAQRRVSA